MRTMKDDAFTPRRAVVCQHGTVAGRLEEAADGAWVFCYAEGYDGAPVSLTLPVRMDSYHFPAFPATFEGLLPEGPQLETLLRLHKIDRGDFFRQLVTVGGDLVGSLTVVEESNQKES